MEKKGANAETIQEINRSLVLRELIDNDMCNRAQIAYKTGLTQAAVSKIIAPLVEKEIIKEVSLMVGKKGRRSIGLCLNASRFFVIAVKISRSSYTIGLFDIKGMLITSKTESLLNDMASGDARESINRIKKNIKQYVDTFNNIFAIGISIPGPYLNHEGRLILMSGYPGWEEVNLLDEFSSSFSIPVYIEHDANASAIAEWKYGGYGLREEGVLVHILASEGIGAGVVVNGKVLEGGHGIAGEVGHMSINCEGELCACGNRGCLELYCSALAIPKRAKAQLIKWPDSMLNKLDSIAVEDIVEGINIKDAFCCEIIKQTGYYLGCGIANVINMYDPNIVVISDVVAKAGDLLMNEIKATVKKRVLKQVYEKTSIVYSKMKVDSALMGAAAVAIDQLLKQPNLLLENRKM